MIIFIILNVYEKEKKIAKNIYDIKLLHYMHTADSYINEIREIIIYQNYF